MATKKIPKKRAKAIAKPHEKSPEVAPPGPIKKLHEWQVYTIALENLSAGRLNLARPVGRHSVWMSGGKWVAGDIGANHNDCSLMQDQRSIIELVNSLESLDRVPDFKARHYEIRELRVPPISLDCFWLHSNSGGNDQFMSFMDLPRTLTKNWVYSQSDFIELIKPLIRRSMEQVFPAL